MLTEVLQLKNQLALAQAQRESFINMRQVPEEQHLAIIAAKDALIKELVSSSLAFSKQHSRSMILPQVCFVCEQEAKVEALSRNAIGNSASTVKLAMQEELITKLEDENKQLVEEVDRMKKDQDELLELLTEQDNRISGLKGRLRELGAHVSDSCLNIPRNFYSRSRTFTSYMYGCVLFIVN